jgi:hypothetical protein
VATAVVLGPASAFADIGENFKAAGIQFGGYADAGVQIGTSGATGIEAWWVTIAPEVRLLLVDNLSADVQAAFDARSDPFGVELPPLYGASLGLGATYYFVVNPRASTGVVPAVGLRLSIGILESFISVYPYAEVMFFVRERISPYVYVTAVELSLFPGTGLAPQFLLTPSVEIGVAFHVPTADRVLVHK